MGVTSMAEAEPSPEALDQARKATVGAPQGNVNAQSHGLYRAKRALNELGLRGLDGRTTVAKELNLWRAEIAEDLGGMDMLSTAQLALLELAVKQKLLLDSIDAWILQQPSMVNKRKRALFPIVRERQVLADGLERYLSKLGLERVARPITSALDLVHAKTGDGAAGGGAVIDLK